MGGAAAAATQPEQQEQDPESQAPLLQTDGDSAPSSSGGGVLGAVPRLLHLAVPTAAWGMLLYGGRLITVAQVGRLGSLALSSLALAQTLYNITGLSLVIGMCSAITTFVGAAHGAGAQQAHVKGQVLQRGVLIGLLTALLPLLAWTQAPRLLAALGQEPALSAGAARYVWRVAPALLVACPYYSLCFYLQAQGAVRPLVAAMAVSVCLTPLLNAVFIAREGFVGVANTLLLLSSMEVVLLSAIAAWHNRKQPPRLRPWGGFSTAACGALGPYLAVALPSCAMTCLEWWALEGLTIIAGLLPDARVAVGAVGICFNLHVIVFLLVDGVGASVTIRVANTLGAGCPGAARQSVLAGVGLGFGTAAACAVPLWFAPAAVARVFSNDAQVVALVVACCPALVVGLLSDSINVVLSSSIRGAGRQRLGAAINLCTYWLLGLPLAALLALPGQWGFGLGARGLWLGMAVTSSVQALTLAAVLSQLDWGAEAERSKHLVRSQTPAHELAPPGGQPDREPDTAQAAQADDTPGRDQGLR